MNSEAVIGILERHPMFGNLPAGVLHRLVALGSFATLPAGEYLFRKGDEGATLYCILEGSVQISVEEPPGRVNVMNRLPAGSLFGEIALLDALPRTTDALALEPLALFTIERGPFQGLLDSEPALVRQVVRMLCDRLRWTSETVDAKNRAEHELRKLTQAVEHSPNTVIITDAEGTIEYVNPKFSELTGWQPEEAVGRNPRMFQSGHTPRALYEQMWEALLAGREWRGELQNRKKNGELFWESCSISPVRGREGRITHFVAVKEDTTLRRRLEEELRRLATTDPLTGVANRRHFMEQAAAEVGRVARTGAPLAVLMLDVDHFKKVNDSYGHAVGDTTLRQLAATVGPLLREADLLGRLGGEEFAVLLPYTTLADAAEVAERLRVALAAVVVATELGELRFTVSIGASDYLASEATIDPAMQRADEGLYAAKQGGRNRVVMRPAAGASRSAAG